MLKLSPSSKKLVGTGAVLVTAVMLLILTNLSCHKKFEQTPAAYREAGSPKIDFNDPTVAMFGKVQGPFVFIKALSPSLLQLSDTHMKSEVVRLVGLSDLPYPDPTPAPSKDGLPTPAPEAPTIKEARLQAIHKFKMDGIGNLLGTNQLWLVRLSKQSPSPVYLFVPDTIQQADKPATGGATLVNAQLLRKGLANMDLDSVGSLNQPLFDMLLESQLTAVAEAQRKTGEGESLWTKFQMQMPMEQYSDRLEDVKKRM